MPVVPFTAAPGRVKAEAPQPDDAWLLMAAAQMDAQGRLLEREGEAESAKTEDPKNG